MNKLDTTLRALLAAGRSAPISTEVPAGFERRVLKGVRSLHRVDPLAEWSQWLWRAVAPALGAAVVAGCLEFSVDAAPEEWAAADPGPDADLAVFSFHDSSFSTW